MLKAFPGRKLIRINLVIGNIHLFSRGLSDPVALLLSLYDVLHYALSCVHILTSSSLQICFLHDKEIHTFSSKYVGLNKAEFSALFESLG